MGLQLSEPAKQSHRPGVVAGSADKPGKAYKNTIYQLVAG